MWRRGLMVGVLMGSLVGSAVAAAVVTGVTERVLDSGPTGDAEAAVLVPGPEGLILINPGSHALSSVPNLVNFQGILTEPGGLPVVDGPQSVTFRIYDAASGGAALWTETQSLTTAGGLFHTLLGSVTAFPAGVFNGTPRYLEVQVNADPPMTPRQQIVSVPYAFHAGTADSANTADTADTASDVQCSGCVDPSDLAAGAGASALGAWDLRVHNTIYLAATDGFAVAVAGAGGFEGRTDSNNPPTTVRADG